MIKKIIATLGFIMSVGLVQSALACSSSVEVDNGYMSAPVCKGGKLRIMFPDKSDIKKDTLFIYAQATGAPDSSTVSAEVTKKSSGVLYSGDRKVSGAVFQSKANLPFGDLTIPAPSKGQPRSYLAIKNLSDFPVQFKPDF